MYTNLSLVKLLFEEDSVEGRLKVREKLPRSNLMSDSIVSHNDILNIICPKIAKSIQDSGKIKKAMAFYDKLEKGMKKYNETDVNKLYLKMNRKAKKEFKKHLEVAKSNLGYLDQKKIHSLFLKNTNMGRAGKTHINPVQMKAGADQVEGAYEVDLQIYEDLQVVTFFMSNIDSETLTNFGSQGKHLVMYLAPGSCMYVKKENVELFNEAFITDSNYKITSEDQIFWAYEKVSFVYIKPEEIPKLQANPRKEIMRLLSLRDSRKGNKTNIEKDDEDQKLDSKGKEDRPDSSEDSDLSDKEVKLNAEPDKSEIAADSGDNSKKESYIYKRGISSLLQETSTSGKTIQINLSDILYQHHTSDVDKSVTNREKDFIESHVRQISNYTAGKFDELSSYSIQTSREKFEKKGTMFSYGIAGLGLAGAASISFAALPIAIPAALGVWIASDKKGPLAKLASLKSAGAKQKKERELGKNNSWSKLYNNALQGLNPNEWPLEKNLKEMTESASNEIVSLVGKIKAKQDNYLFNPSNSLKEKEKLEVNLKIRDVNSIASKFISIGDQSIQDLSREISSETKEFDKNKFTNEFSISILVKINYILSAFGARIESVELQDAKTSFTNDFVSQILSEKKKKEKERAEAYAQYKDDNKKRRAGLRKGMEDKIARKFARVKKDGFEYEDDNDPRLKGSDDANLPAHEVLEKILVEIKKKRSLLSNLTDKEIYNIYNKLDLKDNKKILGNLLLEKKKDNSFSNLSSSEKKKVIEYLTSKKLETFLDVIEAINYCDDIELITSMFTYIHSEPNDFAKTFDSLRSKKSDLNKALSKLGDLNKIKKLLKEKISKASSKEKKSKEKEEKIKKAAGKKLGVKSESVDLRKEWLRLWDI